MAPKRSYLESDSSDVTSDSDSSTTLKVSNVEPQRKIAKESIWGGNDVGSVEGLFSGGVLSTRSKKLVEKELALEEQLKKSSGMKISKRELNPDLARIRDLDEDEQEKELMDFYGKQVLKEGSSNRVSTMQKLHRKTNACPFCPESDRFMQDRGHEILSMNTSMEGVYMSYMGSRSSIHKYHFRLVPMSHKPSMVTLEENTYSHLKVQKKRLFDFLATRNYIPLFVEIASSLPSMEMQALGGGNHCNIEVFVVETNMVEEAQMRFRAALENTGAEWSQHKKIISTEGKEDAPRGIIPANIPYMHVSFGMTGGFGHVLEVGDDEYIDNQAGTIKQFRDVIRGLYGENVLYRKYRNRKSWTEGIKEVRKELLEWGGDQDVLKDPDTQEKDCNNSNGGDNVSSIGRSKGGNEGDGDGRIEL